VAITKRAMLKSAIQAKLFPKLLELGFKKVKSTEPRLRTCFAREHKDGVAKIDVKMMSLDRAAFSVLGGVAPLEGIVIRGKNYPPDELTVESLDVFFTISRIPKNAFTEWWWLWHWSWQTPTAARYGRLVDRVISYLPELEKAFETGQRSRHIRRIEGLFGELRDL
jgi:hypothetical protein